MKVQSAMVVTLTSGLVWAWVLSLASHFKVLRQSLLCYGQGTATGTVRRAVMYDMACFQSYLKTTPRQCCPVTFVEIIFNLRCILSNELDYPFFFFFFFFFL